MLKGKFGKIMLGLAASSFIAGAVAASNDHVAPMQAFANDTVAGWVASDVVISAIKAQNAEHAGLSQADIDAMDQQWRAETGAASQPLIQDVLSNELSAYLKNKAAETQGLVTEVFVMDNKGLNVGQSDVTSDYWQGDEAKWKKTFLAGPDAVFVDEVEMDESTQTFQSQVSMAITDPASGQVIGAITVGVNVEAIM